MSVEDTLTLLLVEADGQPLSPANVVTAALRYDPADPYAVTVDFGSDASGPNRWSFARDLLATALVRDGLPSGDGDVRAWLTRTWEGGHYVTVTLDSGRGRCRLLLDHRKVRTFVGRTYGWVPYGQEPAFTDVDSAIAQLLADRP